MMSNSLEQAEFSGDLRHLIDRSWQREDILSLCEGLGIDYETLPGDSENLKVNALIVYSAQQGKLRELLQLLRQQRPQKAPAEESPAKRQKGRTGELPALDEVSILDRYFQNIERLIKEDNLRGSIPGSEVRAEARKITLTTLRQVDPEKKRQILTFLYGHGLIVTDQPIINLEDADFSEVSLSWSKLSGINLRNTILEGADFSLASLRDSNLSGALLRRANLRGFFVRTEMIRADLREADLTGARLTESNLAGANLRLADLSGADLNGANLTGTDLTMTRLSDTNFTGANLSFANLSQTNLSKTIFDQAVMTHVDLSWAEIPAELSAQLDELGDISDQEQTDDHETVDNDLPSPAT